MRLSPRWSVPAGALLAALSLSACTGGTAAGQAQVSLAPSVAASVVPSVAASVAASTSAGTAFTVTIRKGSPDGLVNAVISTVRNLPGVQSVSRSGDTVRVQLKASVSAQQREAIATQLKALGDAVSGSAK